MIIAVAATGVGLGLMLTSLSEETRRTGRPIGFIGVILFIPGLASLIFLSMETAL